MVRLFLSLLVVPEGIQSSIGGEGTVGCLAFSGTPVGYSYLDMNPEIAPQFSPVFDPFIL